MRRTKRGQVRETNHILAKYAFVGNETPEGRRGTGWHLLWYCRAFVLIYKENTTSQRGDTTEKCTLFFPRWFGYKARQKIQEYLVKGDERVLKRFFEAFCPWREDSKEYTNRKKMVAQPWQQEITEHVLEFYKTEKMASILLIGPPRKGKSTTAWFIAQAIAKYTKFGKILITPIDFTVPGRGVLSVLDTEDDDCAILLRDECEDMYKKALGTETNENKEFTCWAEKKGSLNTVDDFLLEQERVIILDTTNVLDIHKIEEYSSFVQRHHLIFMITEDDTLECLKK